MGVVGSQCLRRPRIVRKELLNQRLNNWQRKDLVARRSIAGRHLQHELYNCSHLLTEVLRNSRILALYHFLVQALHIVGSKWRDERTHLVEHAAERPDVTFGIVRHVSPNLRTRIVRRSGLGITQSFFNNFGDVQITQFGLHISVKEDVGALHVSVQNLSVVKSLKSSYNLNEHVPDFLFFDVRFSFLIVADFLENVSVISILHDQAARKVIVREIMIYTYHKELLLSSIKASLYETTLGWFIEARIRTSFKAFSFSLSDKLSILTFFSA